MSKYSEKLSQKSLVLGHSLQATTDWPKLGVGRSVQILEILQYSSGLRPTLEDLISGQSRNEGNLAAALILNQNPFFEIAYSPEAALPFIRVRNC